MVSLNTRRSISRLAASVALVAIVVLAGVVVSSYLGIPGLRTAIHSESSDSIGPSFSGWKYSVNGTASGVAITLDGAYLAVGTQSSNLNGSIYLFERNGSAADSGPTILWHRNVQTSILFIAMSRDGSLIAAAGSQFVGRAGAYTNNTVYVFNRDGAVLWNYVFPSPAGPLLLSPDNSRLVVRDQEAVVCFNATSGSIIWQQEIGGTAITTLSTNGNGTELAVGGGEDVYLLSMKDGHQLWDRSVPGGYGVGPVAISGDGAYVAGGSVKTGTDGLVYFMNGKTGSLLWTRHIDSDVLSASLSHDGSRVAFGTNDWIFLCNRSGSMLWNDTYGNAGVLVVPKPSPSGGSDVFAGLWAGGPTVVLINGSTGRPEWTASVGAVRQIAIDGNANLAAVAAGPSDSGPFLPSGSTVYLFPLSKGIS